MTEAKMLQHLKRLQERKKNLSKSSAIGFSVEPAPNVKGGEAAGVKFRANNLQTHRRLIDLVAREVRKG